MVKQAKDSKEAKNYVHQTSISGLYLVTRDSNIDLRGGFRMIALSRELEDRLGQKFEFAQWNHSWSRPNVIRGIHPDPWDKLVYPVTGKIFIAIADINPTSPTFGKAETFTFDEEKGDYFALFISKGLGNSLCNFGEDIAHYLYLVNDYWDGTFGSAPRAITWDDPDLAITWPVKNPILSDSDKNHSTLRERFPDKFS